MIEATASPYDGRVARLQLRGVATGYETIRLATGHGAATPFFVAAQTVTVDSLFVGALSPASTELRLAPAGALPPGSSFEVEYGLRQLLLAEGSEARLFGVANFSDGTSQLVPHAQLNASSTNLGLELISEASTADGSTPPWRVRVGLG